MTAGETRPPYYTRYGLARTGDRDAPLVLEPYPEICHRGALRAAVLAAAIDIAGSLFARERAGDAQLHTTDLSLRAPARAAPKRILVRARPLGGGASTLTTAVALEADGEPWAHGETGFRQTPRPAGAPSPAQPPGMPRELPRHPLARALADDVGIEVRDPARGRAVVELRDALRNPQGVMQGALVALLAEVAALALAEHALAAPQVVTELDLRYLAPARIGPVEAQASFVRAPADRMLRAELRDRGDRGRIAASALLRCDAGPNS